MVVGQNLPDQLAVSENIETDRRFGMFAALRPAGDAIRIDLLDMATQRAHPLAAGIARKSGARSDALPYRFDRIALVEPRRAITCGCRRRRRIERIVFMRIVKQSAAVVVDIRFPPGRLRQ